jgi:hypothetical protein
MRCWMISGLLSVTAGTCSVRSLRVILRMTPAQLRLCMQMVF